jgi:hypothetical protein
MFHVKQNAFPERGLETKKGVFHVKHSLVGV